VAVIVLLFGNIVVEVLGCGNEVVGRGRSRKKQEFK